MKDIDFDELDKAVSSILGDNNKPPTNSDQPVPGDQPAASSSVPVTTSTSDNTVPVSTFNAPKVDSPASDSVASLPLSTRRNGRFMDVVHPSSDMGGPATPSVPRASLPMTARTLQPVDNDVTPEAVEPVEESDNQSSPVDEQMPITKTADPATLISTEDTHDTIWPDPLDVHESVDTTPVDVPATQSKIDTLPASLELEPIAPIVETAPLIDSTQAPTSPFISDAKVEKRPLGAFSNQPVAPITPESPSSPEITNGEEKKEDEQLAPEVSPVVTTASLPRELESDVVALEGNDHTVEADAPAPDPESEQEVTPAESATPPVSGATLSIPQQYKTAERNQKDSDEHPIFDTTEYHAAFPAKTKKKSSLGVWISILVLLIVLVAAAGVWWFYLK